jgi:hypothetical protein
MVKVFVSQLTLPFISSAARTASECEANSMKPKPRFSTFAGAAETDPSSPSAAPFFPPPRAVTTNPRLIGPICSNARSRSEFDHVKGMLRTKIVVEVLEVAAGVVMATAGISTAVLRSAPTQSTAESQHDAAGLRTTAARAEIQAIRSHTSLIQPPECCRTRSHFNPCRCAASGVLRIRVPIRGPFDGADECHGRGGAPCGCLPGRCIGFRPDLSRVSLPCVCRAYPQLAVHERVGLGPCWSGRLTG